MITTRQSQIIDSNIKPGNVLFYAVVLLLLVVYLVFQPATISIEHAQNLANSYDSKVVLYLIAFAIMLLCALTPLPAESIALVNAVIFSPAEAFLVTWLSAVLSAQLGYEFGRLNKIDPCKYDTNSKICRWLNGYGYKALAIMRLIPVVPFFALNICGGIFKLGRCKYMVITALCITPAVALLTFFPQLFI